MTYMGSNPVVPQDDGVRTPSYTGLVVLALVDVVE